jgi:hypothetical protein
MATTTQFGLDGVASSQEWLKRLGEIDKQVRAIDDALTAQRSAARTRRWIVAGVVFLLALPLGWEIGFPGGIFVAVVGMVVLVPIIFKFMRGPAAHFIGPERTRFMRDLLAELGKIAPDAPVALKAQLDSRKALPEVQMPRVGSGVGQDERAEEWLSGSLPGIPGLRLAWKVSEWRRVQIKRKVTRKRTKVKAKMAFACALSVRLDADRALFQPKTIAAAPANPAEGVFETRETPRGWSIRGRRDIVVKTELGSDNLYDALPAFREQGKRELLGAQASSLLALMKLCEGRLVPRAPERRAA